MKAHAIVAAITLAVCLLFSAMAPSIDKATGTLNFDDMRGAAKHKAIQPIGEDGR